MEKLIRSLVTLAVLLGASGVAIGQELAALIREDQNPVPVLAYAQKAAKCRGIAVISPGTGGSEKGYRYLGDAMASLGYLAVVVGHQESGRRALREHMRDSGMREGLAELIVQPDAYRARFMDIAATRQWAQARCGSDNSVLIGHSMGAATVLMEAGATNKVGIKGANSFDAYIALSPQGPGSIFPDNAWAGIGQAVLLVTGTRDSELGGASWQSRTEPFNSMPAGCKWLAVVDGATHMHFAGLGLSQKTQSVTARTVEAFLAGIDRGDCKLPEPIPGVQIENR